jgi:hypothetical protein
MFQCLQVVTSVSKCCRVFQQPTVAERSAVPVFKCFECFSVQSVQECSIVFRSSVTEWSTVLVFSELMSVEGIYSDSRTEECLNVDTVSFQSCLQSIQGSVL